METIQAQGEGNTAQPGNMTRPPEFWRYIFDAIEDPMFLHDVQYRVLLANRAYYRLAGVTEAEALSKPYWEVFPPGTGPLPGCKDAANSKNHDGSQEEVRVGPKLYLSKSYTVRDDQGKLLHSLHIMSDITAQRQNEAALAESEKTLRRAIDTARDAIISLDEERGVVTANPAAESMFGYSREEMIGQVLHEIIVPPRFREAMAKGMAHFFTTGEGAAIGKTLELAALHKNGTEFPIELSLSAMQIDGKWQATGIARDISERKRAENKNLRLTQIYLTISRCNEALVHASDESGLAHEMCQILTKEGNFRTAWVGYAEQGADKRIRPVAAAGIEEEILESLKLTWADEEHGQGAAAAAIRTGQIVICHDIRNDGAQCQSEREQTLQQGHLTVIALPLKHDRHGFDVLVVYGAQANEFTEDIVHLLTELADDLAFGIGNLRSRAERTRIQERLENSLDNAVIAIAATVESRDPYTAGHQRRVAKLATAIATEMGLPDDEVRGLHTACVVHDIGKIHVPAEILSSPAKLTDAEFQILKTHPQIGWEILKGIDFLWPVAEIVYQHHERLNGTGYPRGLKGDEILLDARILAVADVVEAMTSHRPYRAALGIFSALQEISRNKGKLYDAAVVESCLRIFMEKNYEF